MKRRSLLVAPLAVLVPGGMAQALKLAFDAVARGSLMTREKEQSGGMARSTTIYELRIYHVVPGKMEDLISSGITR